MEISPKAEAASCRLHKPMCAFRVAQGLLRARRRRVGFISFQPSASREPGVVATSEFETEREREVRRFRWKRRWSAHVWIKRTGTAPTHLGAQSHFNTHRRTCTTWRAGWLAFQSPRLVSVQGPGLCNSTIFWPGERLQDCRRRSSAKKECFFPSSSSLLHLSVLSFAHTNLLNHLAL